MERAPLWAHAALVGVLLFGLLFALRPLGPYTSDEGSALLQARQLAATGEWAFPTPPLQLDPDGKATIVPHGDIGTKGRFYYSKHPVYPLLLRAADAVGGRPALFVLSVAGGLLAAVGAALLARQLAGGHERATLWFTAFATPLFFDSFVVLAHTLLAAATVFALLCALRGRPIHLALLFVLVAFCAVIRSEGAFVGPALAFAFLVVRRSRHSMLIAVVAMTATIAGFIGDRLAAHAIIGDLLPPVDPDETGWLVGRIQSASWTMLFPGADMSTRDIMLFLAAFFVAVGALLARRRERMNLAFVCWTLSTMGLAIALSEGTGFVPGLLVAAPLLTCALFSLRRSDLSDANARILLIFVVIGALGVFATQWSTGGGPEWGGRYFAYLLPALAPIAVIALRRIVSNATPGMPLVSLALFAVFSLDVIALTTIRSNHREFVMTENVVRQMTQEHPVVVWTERFRPQVMWKGADSERWLIADPVPVDTLLGSVVTAGESRVVLVTTDAAAALVDLERHGFVVVEARPVWGERVAIEAERS